MNRNDNQEEPRNVRDSVSRASRAGQVPDADAQIDETTPPQHDSGLSEQERSVASFSNPTSHVVLYQPEIPQNTGNIGRSCVAVGAKLWIVRPAGFRMDDARLRRAGLDYWQHLQLGDAVNWDDLIDQLSPRRLFFFSRFATRTIWDVKFEIGDTFVFGRETSGLPKSILDPQDPRALRLPMSPHVRSLNLATTVGIVLYEHQRQTASAPSPQPSPPKQSRQAES